MKKKRAMEDESEADPARNDLMKKAVAAFQAARNKVEMGLVQLLKTEGRAGNIKIDTMEAAYSLYLSAKSDKLFEGLYEAECREAGLKKPPEHSIQFTRPLRAVAIRSPKVQKELRDKEAQKRFKGTLNNMSNALIAADSRIREEHGGKLPPEVPAGTVAAKIKAIGSLTEAYKLGREIGQAGASKPKKNKPKKKMYPKPPQVVCAAWAKIAEAGEGGQIYCMMLATEYEGDKLTATSSRVILVRANDIQAGRVMFEPVTDGEKEAVALMSIPTTFTDKKTDADADKIIEENGDQ